MLRRVPALLAGLGVAVAVLVAALRLTVVDLVVVGSDSMAPTLCPGDRLVLLTTEAARRPARNALVAFTAPDDGVPTVKRVVGVAGQRVELWDGALRVDGVPPKEPYVDLATVDGTFFGPVEVPDAHVFVLGDEREGSIDSRHYGPVPVSSVRGRVLLRWWSGDACGQAPHAVSASRSPGTRGSAAASSAVNQPASAASSPAVGWASPTRPQR